MILLRRSGQKFSGGLETIRRLHLAAICDLIADLAAGRVAAYQRTISRRASIVAVNSVVTMPTVMVTAKPRTGPLPKMNSITCARNAVALLSMMVE